MVYHRAKHTRYKLEAFVAECEPFAPVPSGNGHSNRKPKTASSSVGDSPGDPQKNISDWDWLCHIIGIPSFKFI